MSRPLITIHNAETGEIIEREMNDAEWEQALIDKQIAEARQAEAAAKAAQRQALLDKLGITEDEARLLLGGN
jgi:hypothetical protein